MSKQPEALRLASAMNTASVVIGGLPELSGYNGSLLLLEDVEQQRICQECSDAAEELRRLYALNVDLLERIAKLDAAVAAERDSLRAALLDTLEFLERHSNRWDGVNGKHPHEIAEAARAAIAKTEAA